VKVAGFTGPGDAIHSQQICMTPALLSQFYDVYKIRPYTILQRPGEAVYIPAGCPHQVSNAVDAIKIACDFISIENLAATYRLVGEFREHRLSQRTGDDVLQLFVTLWFAWMWLSRQPMASTIPISEGPSGTEEMLVDDEDVQMAEGKSFAAGPMGSAHPSTGHAEVAPALTKAQRSRAKNQAKRKTAAVSEREPKPSHKFTCPLCPGTFNRNGLINHLKSTHESAVMVEKLNVNSYKLRKEGKISDNAFDTIIRSFVVIKSSSSS